MRFFYIIFLLFAPVYAWAYLDPGTGSLLLYAIIGVAASIIFALRNLWYRIIEIFFARKSRHRVPNELPDIVFHSEGGHYWHVFQPVMKHCATHFIECAYVTPDPKDPAFEWAKTHDSVSVIHVGTEMMTLAWMNRIKTRIVVSTTPNLDVYMWKRSPYVERYVHLFHAPTTVEFYEKYALCFYDDIIGCGKFQESGIRELDEKRKLPQKRFLIAGLTYYDYMIDELNSLQLQAPSKTEKNPIVLYAPSWGIRSSLSTLGIASIRELLAADYRVIFRPHPQSLISDKEILAEIYSSFSDNPLFKVDTKITGLVSMNESDLLITDFSGMLFDYAFLFGKPIILAALEAPTGGYEAENLDGSLWDVETARILSREFPKKNSELPKEVTQVIATGNVNMKKIEEIRNHSIANYGNAGPAVANCILSILGELAQ